MDMIYDTGAIATLSPQIVLGLLFIQKGKIETDRKYRVIYIFSYIYKKKFKDKL